MSKLILIVLAFLLIISCKDNKEPWLQEYQNTKCTWAKNEAKFKADSIQNIGKLSVDLISIKKEIDKFSKPIQSEIIQLNHKIKEINIKYLNESHKISEMHEQIYGHISTPEFEKKLQQNDEKNESEVLSLENKIVVLQSKLKDNKTFQELISKQNKVQQQITKISNAAKEKYAVTFDSLQGILDSQKSEFKGIMQNLSESDKRKFIKQRGEIRANPCKELK